MNGLLLGIIEAKKVSTGVENVMEQAKRYAKAVPNILDAIEDAEIKAVNSTFEESIPDILAFVKQDNRSFPFFFIDPTGWSGFSMKAIAPLLAHHPGEVLINFMMGHIIRFLDSDQGKTQESFQDLFGLIYATRSPKGVEVFKEAEKKAMEVQEKARAKADIQRREA